MWTVRPTTQLPLPWAAKVSESWACGMAGTCFGVNRRSCSLESFCSSVEGGVLGYVVYVFLNSLIFPFIS